jgi:hypothetical protein
VPKRVPAHLFDLAKEEEIISCIIEGTFDDIPAESLCSADAFTDPRWRLIYSVACALRNRREPTPVGVESVNDAIAFHGHDFELQRAVDPAEPPLISWQRWPEYATHRSLAFLPKQVGYALVELEKLHIRRAAMAIHERLGFGEIGPEQSLDELAAIVHGDNGAADPTARLTMMTVSQILAYEDNPADILLSNGYIERGSPCVLCGPPGIGKSRLALQLAIKSILGQGFLGWDTSAYGLKWAFLQNENGLRRLKADLRAMCGGLTSTEMEALEKNLLIHAIVNDLDGHLDLGDAEARKRVVEVIQDWKPDIVVGDPLTAFSTGDLNTDQDMLRAARGFGRIVREGDPRRVPFVLHHARTGKEAKAGVAGADRSSYARNSKALYGWTRAQFNVAPVDKDNNDRLIFASGKCNNAPEFAKFIIELDLAAMFYAKTDDDPDEVMMEDDIHGEGGKFSQKFHRKQILVLLSAVTPLARKDIKRQILDRIHMSGRTFDSLWAELKEFEEIEETGDHKWLSKPTI